MYEAPSRGDITNCVVTAEVFTDGAMPKLFNGQGQQIMLGEELRPVA